MGIVYVGFKNTFRFSIIIITIPASLIPISDHNVYAEQDMLNYN